MSFKRQIKKEYGHFIKYKKRIIDYCFVDNKYQQFFYYCFSCEKCDIAIDLLWLKTKSKKSKKRCQQYWISNNFIHCNEMIIKKLLE